MRSQSTLKKLILLGITFGLVLPSWLYLGLKSYRRDQREWLCIFVKTQPTLQLLFRLPRDYSAEEVYLNRLEVGSRAYRQVTTYRKFGLLPGAPCDSLPSVCF